jgi:hypothetical protein
MEKNTKTAQSANMTISRSMLEQAEFQASKRTNLTPEEEAMEAKNRIARKAMWAQVEENERILEESRIPVLRAELVEKIKTTENQLAVYKKKLAELG